MSLSSPNEPTELEGEDSGDVHVRDVYDSEGLHAGFIRDHEPVDAPSEDMARIILHLSDDARRALDAPIREADVEAIWLHGSDQGNRLILDRPLREALIEQGFDL